jgi:hypothetical protein
MSVRFGEMEENLTSSWTEDKTGKKTLLLDTKKNQEQCLWF